MTSLQARHCHWYPLSSPRRKTVKILTEELLKHRALGYFEESGYPLLLLFFAKR